MKAISCETDYRCPIKLEESDYHVNSVVNSIAVCTGLKWEEIVKSLIEQAHIRAYMPSYITCVTDMLRINGFSTVSNVTRLSDLLDLHTGKDEPKEKYIVKFYYHGHYAVVPDFDKKGYCIKSMYEVKSRFENRYIEKCWKYEPGTDNRTGIRRSGFTMPSITKPHENLAVKNMNPQDHNISDCSVRALSAALECTWDEAIDLLIKASRYIDPIINSFSNISNALIGLNFERHRAMRLNGRLLTGKQFCEQMTHTYHNGEHIFAYVGASHCVAVLPFVEENGSIRYKTQDTWDSTDRKVGDYWVIPPKSQRERMKPKSILSPIALSDLSVGNTFTHPRFGKGSVICESNNILTIDFDKIGTKKISKEWLIKTIVSTKEKKRQV